MNWNKSDQWILLIMLVCLASYLFAGIVSELDELADESSQAACTK